MRSVGIAKGRTNGPGFVSEHPGLSSYSRQDGGDRLTKILTKTVRRPTTLNDARAPGGHGRFGFVTAYDGPRQPTAEAVG